MELERLGRVQRVAAEGGPQVVLDLALDATARLSMRAAPARTPGEVEATLTDKRGAQLDEPCPLLFVLDGQPGAPPAPQSSADKLTRTWQLRVSSELLRDMNRAQVLALRACEQRWTLAREQRELLAQFAEELAVIGAVPAPRER